MRLIILLALILGVTSCTKDQVATPKPSGKYYLQVKSIDLDGKENVTPIILVTVD